MSSDLTPTTRTLRKLEADGWMAQDVEKWIPHTQIRKDLYNVGDVIAVKACWTLLVQATSDNGGNSAKRVRKIKAEPMMHIWLSAGLRRVQVWAWKATKAGNWKPRITEIELKHLDPKQETA